MRGTPAWPRISSLTCSRARAPTLRTQVAPTGELTPKRRSRNPTVTRRSMATTPTAPVRSTSGEITYYHRAVTPVLVAPGQPEVIALRPEFITPQDGHTKQDCELAAAKRWLEPNATRYHSGPLTLLGDDLYAHQPFCRRALLHDCHFLFVCKPDSHKTLYDWVNLLRPGPEIGRASCRGNVQSVMG